MFQRDKDGSPDAFETGLPPAQSGEDVPQWLVILGLAAGLTLLVALLRYAIDLLGVVFVIILVGFAIRAFSDWLTEGESVSGWAMSALSLGLVGTMVVALWLFNSRDMALGAIESRLPGPVQRAVAWMESYGWGQRVLLPGGDRAGALGGGGLAKVALEPRPADTDPAGPVTTAPPRSLPALPAAPAVGTARPRATATPRQTTGEAEAAPRSPPARPATPVSATPVSPPATAAIPTTVTLTASPSPAVVGQSVRLTANVSATGGSPTGTVVFTDDDRVLGRARVRDGVAALVTLDLELGDHSLSAAYEGDGTHLPSRSASISQTVARK